MDRWLVGAQENMPPHVTAKHGGSAKPSAAAFDEAEASSDNDGASAEALWHEESESEEEDYLDEVYR